MKKIAMQSVQMVVKLVPSSIRKSIKRSERLTTFYSQSIRRSGLTYGEPSKRAQKKLYRDFVTRHNQILEKQTTREDCSDLQVIILGEQGRKETIENLRDLGITSFTLVGQGKGAVQTDVSFAEALSSQNKSRPVLLLNAGDKIRRQTLETMFSEIRNNNAAVAYCDTDINLDPKGVGAPSFLPDWNPELQLSAAYVSTGVLIAEGLCSRKQFRSKTIAGLISELWLTNPDVNIRHIPSVLVQRLPHSSIEVSALNDIEKLVSHYTPAVTAFNSEQLINHVQWPSKDEPLVSLIIPTKNGKDLVQACIESIIRKTLYKNFEIILIDNGSDEPESLEYFKYLDTLPEVRVVSYPGPFNYSAINNFGVSQAKGEIIGLINNDIEVIRPDWLTYMVGHAAREDIGCVGAKLLYSDACIQHAGVVLGYGRGAGHAHKYFPRYHPGYMKRLIATQNYSAVTAACLLVKKSKFLEVGGLNEKDLAVAFNDVDFCLRVRETGVRNVYCAEAELYHHESVSRGLDIAPEKAARFNRELEYLRTHWSNYISHDPAYSPNLTLKRENFSIKRKDEYDAA